MTGHRPQLERARWLLVAGVLLFVLPDAVDLVEQVLVLTVAGFEVRLDLLLDPLDVALLLRDSLLSDFNFGDHVQHPRPIKEVHRLNVEV